MSSSAKVFTKSGEAHAEINAINSVKNPELLPESTIYVSLNLVHISENTAVFIEIKRNWF